MPSFDADDDAEIDVADKYEADADDTPSCRAASRRLRWWHWLITDVTRWNDISMISSDDWLYDYVDYWWASPLRCNIDDARCDDYADVPIADARWHFSHCASR